MIFHIPPSIAWKREAVRDALFAKGIPARVDRGVLLVDVPWKHRPNRVALFLRRFAACRTVLGSCDRPHHEFRFYENRFVINLEIHWNVRALAEDCDTFLAVQEVMATLGYVGLGMRQTERDAIRGYGAITRELDQTLSELEMLREDHAARRRDSRQVWDRLWWLNAKIERLCVATFRD
jgi:hypothetical protein